MRIFGFQEYGGPEVVQHLDVPRPQSRAHHLLIEMRAAGINPADIKVRNGARQNKFPVKFPMAVGREAAGVVLEAPADSPFQPGQLVFGGTATGTGALAEFVLLDASQTAPIPAGLSPSQAACIPVAFGTAWDALHELNLAKGSTLLVLGAGGGVGSAAVQLAQSLDLNVVGVASSQKEEFLTNMGAKHVAYDRGDWLAQLALSSDTYAGIIDAAGGDTLRATSSLVPTGAIRSAASPALAEEYGGSGIRRRREGEIYKQLAEMMANDVIHANITHSYPLDNAPLALAAVETGHARGKTVVTNV
ncbi:zinc-binding dehydrogenase [Corynebacterium sp. 4HC-13]|uniref:NADP-dependent oxidoreductase n=1 Tax=Corynebacterium anserum TaxID=2684406 RepID=UPI00163A1FF5|nr:NADP-dependent oxidoreductase [Corynebacterium anserum]MBC2681120.1 zinc-binding dehydrogenase [Corynebacterium anserum]